ncbi:MAG: 3-hydroxybutyrate dehydrogenase [Kiloniellaceae bacterium]
MLNGKTALITGSTSGIGWGIAQALAGQGCDIVLNGFGDADEIEAMGARLAETAEVRVAYSPADMSKPDQIAAMVREAEARFGAIDVLVNNAGIQYTAPIEEFPVEKWDAIIAINLSSTFHTVRAALPAMRGHGWGRVINVASVHGLVASVHKAAYVAAKHGIVGLTKVIALETAGSGVTCNAICPGWVLTPLVQKQIEARAEEEGGGVEAAKKELLSEKQPSGEFVTTAQIGALACYLCTDGAAQMTGAALNIDGGWVAR